MSWWESPTTQGSNFPASSGRQWLQVVRPRTGATYLVAVLIDAVAGVRSALSNSAVN
jgi:hypothetical protein